MRVGAGVVLVDSRKFHSRAPDLLCGDPWSYSRALVASPYDPPQPVLFLALTCLTAALRW
jgi:hypothetical protein